MVWVLGMDENGLGPCLGPLVATGALLEVERYDAEALAEVGRRLGLADSKQVSAFGRMRKVESLVLAFWRERGISGDADALFEGALVGGLKPQQSPCPDALHRQQCWGAPLPLPAFGGDADEGQAILDALAQAGIRLHWLRSQLACADRIHAAQAKGDSRFQLDLMLFEEIALDAARSLGSEMHIVCGMVGGIRRYRGRFRRIDPSRIALIEEAKGRAAYRIEGLGEIRFEVDAERHLPVALASMFGKYMRELATERQHRFYAAQQPDLPRVSGYHDPRTRAFIRDSADLRRRLGILPTCFQR